jgi:hypothetical protein
MAGIMAIASSSVAAATVITTTLPHGLATNSVVSIVGHTGSTPAIDGIYAVTVTAANKFTIPVTVTVAGSGGAWKATAFENVAFSPPLLSVPYQQVFILFARPDNSEFGSSHTELGYMQVNLKYPLQAGTSAIGARAELFRTTFARGNSFVSGGVTVNITDTPEIAQGVADGTMFSVPVKIRFSAFIP